MGAHFTPDSFCASCPETPDLAAARALHARRQLEAAIDHGTAMMAALGLPPLRSMTRAIALLDALDAPSTDLEPDADLEPGGDDETTLGAPENHPGERWYLDMEGTQHKQRGRRRLGDQTEWATGRVHDGEDEANHDGEPEAGYDLACDDDELDGPSHPDDEDSIGWPEHVSQIRLAPTAWLANGDGDVTAPERHGMGFLPCGPDDAEDDGLSEDDFRDAPTGADPAPKPAQASSAREMALA